MNNIFISRRNFLKIMGAAGLTIAASDYLSKLFFKSNPIDAMASVDTRFRREAMFYEKIDSDAVKCRLCPHECFLRNGQRSFCRAREPKDGRLYSLVYELACAVHVDPIEKKPIYHMLPGSTAFSIATAGCNSRCKFCQNWQISQSPPEDTENTILSCEDVVSFAKKNACRSIAYTYSEPTIFYEYMYDTALMSSKENIKNIMVTGGLVNPEPIRYISKYINAAHVDLKGFSDAYLKETCSQRLEPVLEGIKLMKKEGIWVEIINLVIPTMNDDMRMIKNMCAWIKENLGSEVPLHFSRFWPMYKLRDLPPTPLTTLEQARNVALNEGLYYVYIGNITNHESNHTYCPRCKKMLVKRIGYYIAENNISKANCKFCGYKIAGIWE